MAVSNRNISAALLLMGPVISVTVFAEVYMSVEQAAAVFFPAGKFKAKTILLSDDDKAKIESGSHQKVRGGSLKVFVSEEADSVFIDQVIGKHEQITYAVGISRNGKIQGVEILEYRESYGHQIRREAWRSQFKGKDKSAELKVGRDIKNLSGATLSSNHVTDGVRRILQTHEQIKSRL